MKRETFGMARLVLGLVATAGWMTILLGLFAAWLYVDAGQMQVALAAGAGGLVVGAGLVVAAQLGLAQVATADAVQQILTEIRAARRSSAPPVQADAAKH